MRIAPIAAALLVLASANPVLASGTIRSQESDGTIRVYHHVSINVVHRTLRITTQDGKGTLVINQAACSYVGLLERCYPSKISLEQGGATKPLDLKRGTIYVNTTGQNQQLPLSSQQLPPHGILLSITTMRDTYVTMTGKIDGLVR
jgi:hypothetical protein